MIIDLGTGIKLRFDPNDVRVSIDGDIIDIGARIKQELPEINGEIPAGPGLFKLPDYALNPYLELSEEIRKVSEIDIDKARNELSKNMKEIEEKYNKKRNEIDKLEDQKAKGFLTPAVEKELDKLEKKIRKTKRVSSH